MSPASLLDDLRTRGVQLRADGGQLRFRPTNQPAEVLAALREHKDELLVLLGAETQPESHADREIKRFLAVAIPWPDGRGWYDPGYLHAPQGLMVDG